MLSCLCCPSRYSWRFLASTELCRNSSNAVSNLFCPCAGLGFSSWLDENGFFGRASSIFSVSEGVGSVMRTCLISSLLGVGARISSRSISPLSQRYWMADIGSLHLDDGTCASLTNDTGMRIIFAILLGESLLPSLLKLSPLTSVVNSLIFLVSSLGNDIGTISAFVALHTPIIISLGTHPSTFDIARTVFHLHDPLLSIMLRLLAVLQPHDSAKVVAV